MTVNSRAKGRRFQSAVRDWWAERVTVVEPGGAGLESTDVLLLTSPVHVSIEAKNHAALDLAGWLDQAVRQAVPGSVAAVQHKRRGRGDIGDCYVTMRAEDFRRLLS